MLDGLRTRRDLETRAHPAPEQEQQEQTDRQLQAQQEAAQKQIETATGRAASEAAAATVRAAPKGFDENDPTTWGNPRRKRIPATCGSGKKFKHCPRPAG